MSDAEGIEFTCSLCGKQENYKLKICIQCNTARYCDEECRNKDWKTHKKNCTIFYEIYSSTLTKQQKKWLMKYDTNQIMDLLMDPGGDLCGIIGYDDMEPIGLRKLLRERNELDKESDYVMWSYATILTRQIRDDKSYCKLIVKKAKQYQEIAGVTITIPTKEFCINMKHISDKDFCQKATFMLAVLGRTLFVVGL
uniref:MYND finger protein n=1 Tax=Pithovirus LCPAC403 TaxID=2506596 RepID=A0A481ZCX8_9VIRU|nr:MAG: MYND finger protein [Pithovirus LCPAC403]